MMCLIVALAGVAMATIHGNAALVVARSVAAKGSTAPADGFVTRSSGVRIYTASGKRGEPAEFVALSAHDKRYRLELHMSVGDRPATWVGVFDGTTVWTCNNGTTAQTPGDLPQKRSFDYYNKVISLTGLTQDRSVRLELKPDVAVGGRACKFVRVTSPDLPSVDLYIDSETFLLTKAVVPAFVVGEGTHNLTETFSDYKQFDNCKVATHRRRDIGPGREVTESTLKTFAHFKASDYPNAFTKP